MKVVILDSMTLGKDINIGQLEEFGEVEIYEISSEEEACERVSEADIVIANKAPLNKRVLECAKNLKMIAITATGYNNVDIEYAKLRGIRVANVAGYSTASVVQHTFALMFSVLEKLSYYDNYVKSGEYCNSPMFTNFDRVFVELAGKTWGIIGLGEIGRGVAKVAESFGCRVIYYSASGRDYEVPYKRVSFDEILAESDILSVHAPLNEKTKNLMDYSAFSKMKKDAIFVNVGRGPIVNEDDLVRALEENLIGGAGLDVICVEPMPKDCPLLRIKDSTKLIVTPHIAWATHEARERLIGEVYKNIKAFLNNEERNVVI